MLLPPMLLHALSIAPTRKWEGRFIAGAHHDRRYKIYLPRAYQNDKPVPLLVMLHGCTQNADDFALGTEMNRYADHYHFLVVYPEQPRLANRGRCWNWFKPEHQVRGRGEPAEIAAVVEQVKHDYVIDENRVYVAGISAGAAMAVILGATYPDVFAAIGVCSGVPYKASTNLIHSLRVMSKGTADPWKKGQAAYNAMGEHRRVMPVMVFHGTNDSTVAPANGDQVITQWAWTNRLALNSGGEVVLGDHPTNVRRGRVPEGRTFTEYIYTDYHGQVIMKKVLVDGMKHEWSGGSSDGSYTDPLGPKASQMLLDFLLSCSLHPEPTVAAKPETPGLRDLAPGLPPKPFDETVQLPRWLKRAGRAIKRWFKSIME